MKKPKRTEQKNYYGDSLFSTHGCTTYSKTLNIMCRRPALKYLLRTVKKDSRERLYIHYGPIRLYCAGKKLTKFKAGAEVLVDSRFNFCNIFGVTRNKKYFETWKWIGNSFW